MHRHRTFTTSVITFFLLLVLPSLLLAEEKKAEEKRVIDLLPRSTVVYAEITEPTKLWDVILKHPILKQAMELDAVKKGTSSPKMAELKKGVTFIEQQIGMNWQKGLSTVTGGGIYFAVDAETEGTAVFIESKDQKTLEKLRDIFIAIARDDAKKKGKPDPIDEVEYREMTAYQTDVGGFTTVGEWLIIFTNEGFGQSIADAYLDGADSSLANHPRFQQARKNATNKSTAWVYFDIKALRSAGVAKKLYQEKTNNPLVEILLGGVLGGLQQTPYATTSLFVEAEQIKLSVEMPHKTEWVKEKREYYFGKQKQGVAQERLIPKENIFTMSTYRDFSGMWLHSSDLFVDRIDAKFAQSNAVLTTLFSGKDFGEEILGSVGPEVQLVVTRQKFSEKSPIPAIKLPSFAAVFTLKDADNMRDDMRRTFQSLLGFLNVVGSQENNSPQLDIEVEKKENTQIIISKFIPPKGEEKTKNAKIHYNFSPTFAFVEDKMILSSTTPLARELVSMVKGKQPQKNIRANKPNTNTEISLLIAPLLKVVNDNRNHLVTQNMLKEGKERKEAEQEIDLVTKIASWFKSSSIQLTTQKESLKLDWKFDLAKE